MAQAKTWLITGASSGLGRGLAERLLERGDRVWATVRQPAVLNDLQARYGEHLRVDTLDLTDVAAVRGAVDRAFHGFGRIDVVASNAGYGVFGAAEEADDAMVAHQIATNLTGSIALIRACLPHLRAQGGGHVLQVSSEGGQIAYPAFSVYHATKWGVEGFVESVAQEVAPFGVRFTLVEPGPVGTGFRSALVRPTPMPAYDATPVGEFRHAVESGAFQLPGDPDKMVEAMIAVAERPDPPLRLVLGGASYTRIREALTRRLDALDAQRDIAVSTDRSA